MLILHVLCRSTATSQPSACLVICCLLNASRLIAPRLITHQEHSKQQVYDAPLEPDLTISCPINSYQRFALAGTAAGQRAFSIHVASPDEGKL